jgi:hypothetical protein
VGQLAHALGYMGVESAAALRSSGGDQQKMKSVRLDISQIKWKVYRALSSHILLEYGPERHFEAGAGAKAI